MWCSSCQQDVPGLGSTSSGTLRCGKCGNDIPITGGQLNSAVESPIAAPSPASLSNTAVKHILHIPRLGDDDWALEAELRGVQRLVASLKARDDQPALATPRFPSTLSAAESGSCHASDASTSRPPQQRGHAFAWLILSLGLAVLSCGVVLLGWSLIAQRQDLWPLGVPLALLGQAGLILGLVLQLDGLWVSNRRTAAAVSVLDGELKNVRQTTVLHATSHAGGGHALSQQISRQF